MAFDRDIRVTLWNAAMERLSGIPVSQALGRPVAELLPHGEAPESDQACRAALEGQSSIGRFLRSGADHPNRTICYAAHYAPLRTPNGTITGGLATVREVTEGQAQWQLLQHQREELHAANEELRVTAEELSAANEELQAQQEELEETADALRNQTQTLETVNRVGMTLAAELDLQRLLQALTDAATAICGAEFGSFFYNHTDEAGESYALYTLSGVPREAFAPFPMPRNTAIFAPTFRGEGVVRIYDVTRDPRFGHNPPYHGMPEGHLPVRSYLAVPVVSRGGHVQGGLFFGHSRAGVFTEVHERTLVPIAAQAAIAIDNAQLYQETQRAVRLHKQAEANLSLLVEASGKLLTSLELDDVLQSILELARAVGSADSYAVWRMEAATKEWRIVTQHGLSASFPKAIPPSEAAGAPDLPVVIENVRTDPRVVSRRNAYHAEGISSLLAAPLHLHGVSSGTITFYYRTPHRFEQSEIGVAEALANLAASAIVTAELHQEQKRLQAETERAQQCAAFLAEASRVLATSLDYETTLQHVAQLVVPQLADWCAIRLVDDAGKVHRLSVAHVDPSKVEWARSVEGKYPDDPNAPHGVAHVLRTGESELYREIPDELLLQAARDAEHLQLLRGLQLTSVLIVPLRLRDEILGAITFVSAESGRHYDVRDLEVAEDLARRAATAIDYARLFRQAHQIANDLAATESRFRRLVDSNIIGISFQDLEGHVTEANEAFLTLLGRRHDACVGTGISWTEFTAPEHRERDEFAKQEILQTGVCAPFEKELVREDGERVPVLVGGALLDEPARGFVTFILDLTERKLLEERAEHLAAIVASSDDAIVSKDLNGVVRSWNQSAERIFGYTADEMVGQPIAILVPPERHGEEPEILRRLRRGERVDHFETERIRKDGGRVDVSVTISPIVDSTGRIIGASKIARNITGQRLLQAELRQKVRDLAEASRQKDQFLAMMAHELRNPLGAISNAVQVLSHSSPEHPAFARALDVSRRQIEQQRRIVDDLLDVSRLTRNRMDVRRERLDICELVRHAVEDFRQACVQAELNLTLRAPETPLWVLGDAVRLAQVLANLLTNALKFTDPGGEIRVKVTPELNAHKVLITVQDTGIGIPSDLLQRLFQPFSQAEQSLARSRGGLGLGLALVKGLTNLHGGEVSVYSKGSGRGATFAVRLPLDEGAEIGPAESRNEVAGTGRRVLVIEDLQDAAETLRDLLELAGHRVEIAASGRAGLDKAVTFRPDVVLCDIGLPGMDGYEVALRLRELPETRNALLVALTGYGQEDDRRRSHEAGFDHHTLKPINPVELQTLISTDPA